MRNLIFAFLIAVSFSQLSAQLATGLESNELLDSLPRVDGMLQNYDANFNKDLYINYTLLAPNQQGMKQKVAEIKEDGSFKIVVDEPLPYQKIILNIGDFYKCNIIANQDVKVAIDINEVGKKHDNFDNKGLFFSGTDAGLNQFYNEYVEYKLDKKLDVRRRKYSAIINRTSQTDFKVRQIRDFYTELEKIEATFTRKKGKEYKWLLENERNSELYGDLVSIFIGKTMNGKLWEECLSHQPAMVSELSNRYYGILTSKLWSHEEKEIRSLSRMIFKADVEDPEEKKQVDLFLVEQDKKKAGVPYDKDIYQQGLEDYINKYENQLADAKLNLFAEKLAQIPETKIGLVAMKGQPTVAADKERYLETVLPLINVSWQKEKLIRDDKNNQDWVSAISEHMIAERVENSDPTLGEFQEYLVSGAGTWYAKANNVQELLGQIRNFYKGKSVVIFIWDTSCEACIEELTRSGVSYDRITSQPIDILTLALDRKSSRALWKDKLAKTFAKGEHIYLDKKLSSEIFEYFQLPPVPSYIYFDNEGNFVPFKVSSISGLDVDEVLETDG
ncbi:TlpA family protein disulfide reductase [Portibacter lacus]|uniref:Thioredoxin-like fold domain-containing protein n=1 Tax=Portibacter lacus TaxID=1099794 RepID=A0AA37SRG0_9BACT|nr:hypothetical protein [Portibacter lacus]GLR17421.1 hypothetical protein GCM10007940_20360 [Portibacter lacus]